MFFQETKNYTIKPTFSMSKGRCYTIQFEKPKSVLAFALMTVKAPRQLQMFVHEPGEEIWFSGLVPNWPDPIFFGSEGQLDIKLRKKTYTKRRNCKKDPNYDYFGMDKLIIHYIHNKTSEEL